MSRGRGNRIVWRMGRGRRRLKGGRFAGLLAVALIVAVARLFPDTSPPPDAPVSVSAPAGRVAGAYTLEGRVSRVSDGDTFVLFSSGHRIRVRLASIDAPETPKNSKRPGQPMGTASRQALARLVEGKTLRLSCFERDHYGRDVCDVPLAGGSTANRELVAMGLAWANMQNRGKYMRDPGMPALQEQARREKLGIWQNPKPVPPWVWRYQCWRRGHC